MTIDHVQEAFIQLYYTICCDLLLQTARPIRMLHAILPTGQQYAYMSLELI